MMVGALHALPPWLRDIARKTRKPRPFTAKIGTAVGQVRRWSGRRQRWSRSRIDQPYLESTRVLGQRLLSEKTHRRQPQNYAARHRNRAHWWRLYTTQG